MQKSILYCQLIFTLLINFVCDGLLFFSGSTEAVMDRVTLFHIDENLSSLEVAALCFLSRDHVNKKSLQAVSTICYT